MTQLLDNMTDRIRKLRQSSLDAVPYIASERARLMTEFYQSGEGAKHSIPVMRAMSFRHMLRNKELYVGEGELIVGERGPAPKAVPTYPELCIHSLSDLDILTSREKTPYQVTPETRAEYENAIIPFWRGKSMRDRIMSELPPEWHDAYEAGMFTEFQEQRSPGHTSLGGKLYRKGLREMQGEIDEAIAALDLENDPQALDKREELRAMHIAAEAMIEFARRNAEWLEKMAGEESGPERKMELLQMAENCRQVPAHAPRTFWQALQAYWFIHVGVISEMNPWDSFNPGRLDQNLYPFFEREIATGDLDEARARELLQAFWIKFHDHPAPPKVGVTAAESGTYTDFALINVGGVKRDGSNAVNDLSYLILDVVEEMRLLQPSSMVQLSKKTPDRFIRRAIRIVKTGFGQPSIFNTDSIIQELVRQGKDIGDAREGGCSGCVEAGAFGREAYILTGYFNIPKILQLTLANGFDAHTNKQIGPKTGDAESFETFDGLFKAFTAQMRYFIDIKIRGNNVIDRLYAKYMPAPFLSTLIDDCIANGRDYHAGGARYNTSYIQGVGLGTISDCLSAIKHGVFEEKRFSMCELLDALKADFAGHDAIRDYVMNDIPRYGNDDDRADDLTREVFDAYYNSVNGRPNTRCGAHRINLLPTTCHVYFGGVMEASPDGRHAGKPVSEGISPVQGADRHGPTAAIRSAAKIDHLRTGGTLLNQKFTPKLLETDEGVENVVKLVRSYFRMDGHHIQFNVVNAETLREAKANPEEYRDLIVRVAGYSDYFVDLCDELQDEIIERTEHAGV